MIPYLANNPYIYGERLENSSVNPSKASTDETLIRSIKNPIPCYQDERLHQGPFARHTVDPGSSFTVERNENVTESLQVPDSRSFLPSPVSRPLTFLENSNQVPYDGRQRYEPSQSRCYSNGKTEVVHLEVPSYNDRRQEPSRRDLATPNNDQSRDLKDTRGYSAQKNFSTRIGEDDKSSNYSRSEASQDPRYVRESSYGSRREGGSYYIEKYGKENTRESFAGRSNEPDYRVYKIPESSVLSESNSITPTRSKNQFSTCTQSVRSGAFLDDIIEKYKDRLLDKDARSENTNFSREVVSRNEINREVESRNEFNREVESRNEFNRDIVRRNEFNRDLASKNDFHRDAVSRTTDYSYKEDQRSKLTAENSDKRIKPSRDIWIQQARNANEFNATRPTLEYERMNKSSQNLITKGRNKTVKNRKRPAGRSSSKEKWTCERRAFEDMVVKVLKSHAKHCPALRKEIDAMKFTRIFNI